MIIRTKTIEKTKRKKSRLNNFELILLSLPVVIYIFIFNYLPMIGSIIAFKDYRYDLGIFGSEWIGFKNFTYFFASNDALRVTLNTLGYNLTIIFMGMVINVTVALLLNQIQKKIAIKTYQTAMFFPYFLSYVVVAFLVYSFLSPSYGILNQMLSKFGIEAIDWYSNRMAWPFILVITALWKGMGYGVLLNYAALIGIDKSYYEAAELDGASKLQQTFYISLPSITPIICIQIIISLGGILNGDFGLHYQVPMNVSYLNKTTEVMSTYVFRSLMENNEIGIGTALGLFQSVVGLFIVVTSNFVIKKIDSNNALF